MISPLLRGAGTFKTHTAIGQCEVIEIFVCVWWGYLPLFGFCAPYFPTD